MCRGTISIIWRETIVSWVDKKSSYTFLFYDKKSSIPKWEQETGNDYTIYFSFSE
jgi:hypothetical protein